MISYNSLNLYELCHSYPGGLSHECKKLHLQEWTARFAEQKSNWLTVGQWCEVNHFSFHTYNYWKHLFKEEVVEQALPDIVPIAVPTVPDSNSSLESTE